MLANMSDLVQIADLLAGYHIGTVTANADPEKRGRVQVETPTMTGLGISVPWASIVHPVKLGGSPTLSDFSVPEIGTKVLLIFPNSNPYTPLILGVMQDSSTHQSAFDTNYPNRYGKLDPNGLSVITDKTAKTVTVDHVSGTHIDIDANGNVTVTTPGTLTATVAGVSTITTPTLTLNGELRVNGGVSVQNDVVTDKGISYNNHTHTGNLGSPTSPPN